MTTLFISHASEDKADFVRSLAEALRAQFDVWYDEYSLKVGDSLREKIDEGLKKADFGVVVLSHSFFSKKWPKMELDGLFSLEKENKKLILPVWLHVTAKEVAAFSPMLAGRIGAIGADGVPRVVDRLANAIQASQRTKEVVTRDPFKAALNSLLKNLGIAEYHSQRLNSQGGAEDVCTATEAITQKLVSTLEEGNVSKKRFFIKRRSATAIDVVGPYSIELVLYLGKIYLNTAREASLICFFIIRKDQFQEQDRTAALSMLEFEPRLIDGEPVKWLERKTETLNTGDELVLKIIERFGHHVDGYSTRE